MISEEFTVIDFETTGLSPSYCRVIEVAAIRVRRGEVIDTFEQLMYPGHRLPSFITELTGITDTMLKSKPIPETVMPQLKDFIGDCFCVAHNAAFDSGFYHTEMHRAGVAHERNFLCTMKLSRRLIHDSPNHKLGTLANHLNLSIPVELTTHRARYDALLAVELCKHIGNIVKERIGEKTPTFETYEKLMKKSKGAVQKYFDKLANENYKKL